MAATEQVILVDENDTPIGTAEKLEAHRNALRHRAFSVFVLRFRSVAKIKYKAKHKAKEHSARHTINEINAENEAEYEILLQQRAQKKYHSPNLWTNTCCSHPRPNEDIIEAGKRRLKEEMGFILPLQDIGQFHYIAHFDNGLTENEIDHVLVGTLNRDLSNNENILPNPAEVQAYCWMTITELKNELKNNPQQYTPWLSMALEIIGSKIQMLPNR